MVKEVSHRKPNDISFSQHTFGGKANRDFGDCGIWSTGLLWMYLIAFGAPASYRKLCGAKIFFCSLDLIEARTHNFFGFH